jgi:hypothetical protein
MPESISARQNRQPERERNARETDPQRGISGREHGTAAPPKYQPKRPQELRGQSPTHRHERLLLRLFYLKLSAKYNRAKAKIKRI